MIYTDQKICKNTIKTEPGHEVWKQWVGRTGSC